MRTKPVMSDEAYAQKMERKDLTPDGSALIPDPTPIAPPLGYIKQPSITERIRDMVRSEHLRAAAEAAGAETFEEANDFDVGDDYDPNSPYEEVYEPPVRDMEGEAAPLPSPTPASTGVPLPSGEGEGARGSEGAAGPPQPPAAPGTPQPARPAEGRPKPS